MSVGTPFHPRTSALNRKQQWREWSGYYAASVYADFHDIEYNAIREAAALIDVSPLFKYVVPRPRCRSARRPGHHPRRDQAAGRPGLLQPWCDEHGKVIDDGTIHRVGETEFRWTAADPQLRWLRMNAAGLEVEVEEVTESLAALALQGPQSRAVLETASRESFADLRYFRRRAAKIGRVAVDVSRTGYTGRPRLRAVAAGGQGVRRLGRAAQGRRRSRHPAGRHARARCHAAGGGPHPARGRLHLGPPRHEPGAELLAVRGRPRAPGHLRQGRLRGPSRADGRAGRRRTGTPPRRPDPRLVRHRGPLQRPGSAARHLADRRSLAGAGLRARTGPGRQGDQPRLEPHPQAGHRAGLGATGVRAAGSQLEMEWTVEGRRGRVAATVTELPFLDLPRKRS